MLDIKKIDHVGIRVREKSRAIEFYKLFGFKLITDTGFEKGHPVIMEHDSGVVLNLLGPATENKDENVLMDIEQEVSSLTGALTLLATDRIITNERKIQTKVLASDGHTIVPLHIGAQVEGPDPAVRRMLPAPRQPPHDFAPFSICRQRQEHEKLRLDAPIRREDALVGIIEDRQGGRVGRPSILARRTA